LTEHTGITREARSLSGCDVGREALLGNSWKIIAAVHHDDISTRIDWGEAWGEQNRFLAPTDTVTIRGRDE
jgi:hypothetical protein